MPELEATIMSSIVSPGPVAYAVLICSVPDLFQQSNLG